MLVRGLRTSEAVTPYHYTSSDVWGSGDPVGRILVGRGIALF